MSEDDYENAYDASTTGYCKTQEREHFISYLFNHKNDEKFESNYLIQPYGIFLTLI